jgi:integrase
MSKLIPAKLRFHDLRHTVASVFLPEGQSVRGVSQRLGHSNPARLLLPRARPALPVRGRHLPGDGCG